MADRSARDIAGTMVTDEVVVCSRAATVDSVSCWEGFLTEQTNEDLRGDTHATYGAWTAAAKGGTRFAVGAAGAPEADEAVVDIATSRVWCLTQNQTLYFRYLGHGRSWRPDQLAPVHMHYPGVLDSSGGAVELGRWTIGKGGLFVAAEIQLREGPDGDDLTFRIGKAAGEMSDYVDIVVSDGDTASDYEEFAAALKWHPGETMVWTLLDQGGAMPGVPTEASLRVVAG